MEQSEAGKHRDTANQDEQQSDSMAEGSRATDLLLGWAEPCVGCENHSAQSYKEQHDSNEMK